MNKKMKRFSVLKNFKELFLPEAAAQDKEKVKSDVVLEAESIINEYFRKMGYAERIENKKKNRTVFIVSAVAAALVLAVYAAVRII
jgi:hypothetical protein